MFQSQPHAIALGFVPPSVVIFTLVQRYAPIQVRAEAEGMVMSNMLCFYAHRLTSVQDSVILQIAIDMTILTGAFICISITWLIISVVGEFVAVMLLVYHLYTIFCLNYIH